MAGKLPIIKVSLFIFILFFVISSMCISNENYWQKPLPALFNVEIGPGSYWHHMINDTPHVYIEIRVYSPDPSIQPMIFDPENFTSFSQSEKNEPQNVSFRELPLDVSGPKIYHRINGTVDVGDVKDVKYLVIKNNDLSNSANISVLLGVA